MNDDFCDALRYAVHSTQPEWRDVIPVHTLGSDAPSREEENAATHEHGMATTTR